MCNNNLTQYSINDLDSSGVISKFFLFSRRYFYRTISYTFFNFNRNLVPYLITMWISLFVFVCLLAPQPPSRPKPPHSRGFLDHTHWRTTVGRTPPDEWSARRRDLHLTTHNTHNRQTSMPPVGFEPTNSAGERPQTYALDRATTGIGP